MREFALRTIEENKEDRAPEAEEILIQSLARLVLGETIRPTATQVQSLSTCVIEISLSGLPSDGERSSELRFKTSLYNGKRVYNNLSRGILNAQRPYMASSLICRSQKRKKVKMPNLDNVHQSPPSDCSKRSPCGG